MAVTPSNMLALGTKAPYFKLMDTISESIKDLDVLKGKKGTVIMFICNHCPFVIHVNTEIVSIANTYTKKGIRFIAISSNDIKNYPQDNPYNMSLVAKKENYPFPYLYDESQDVAKAYDAACTPDFYVFDDMLNLTYRGQLDDSRPGNGLPLTGKDLRYALDCLINNKDNDAIQNPWIEGNITWNY